MVRLYIAWKEPNINPKNIFSCDYSCQYSLRAARNAGLFLPAFLPALKVVITWSWHRLSWKLVLIGCLFGYYSTRIFFENCVVGHQVRAESQNVKELSRRRATRDTRSFEPGSSAVVSLRILILKTEVRSRYVCIAGDSSFGTWFWKSPLVTTTVGCIQENDFQTLRTLRKGIRSCIMIHHPSVVQ